MSQDQPAPEGENKPPQGESKSPSNVFSSSVPQYAQHSARVPERVGHGTFASQVMVFAGGQEMCLDFLLRFVPPPHLAARVMIPYTAFGPFIGALSENLTNFRSKFPNVPGLPPPPPGMKPPSVQEIYEQLKITDDVVTGSYANTVMITHNASDFCMDFILDLFPRPVVTQRIYMSAIQIPTFLDALKRTFANVQAQQQARLAQMQHHQQEMPANGLGGLPPQGPGLHIPLQAPPPAAPQSPHLPPPATSSDDPQTPPDVNGPAPA